MRFVEGWFHFTLPTFVSSQTLGAKPCLPHAVAAPRGQYVRVDGRAGLRSPAKVSSTPTKEANANERFSNRFWPSDATSDRRRTQRGRTGRRDSLPCVELDSSLRQGRRAPSRRCACR